MMVHSDLRTRHNTTIFIC